MGKPKPSCKDFEVAFQLGNKEAKEMLDLHCVIEEDDKKSKKQDKAGEEAKQQPAEEEKKEKD